MEEMMTLIICLIRDNTGEDRSFCPIPECGGGCTSDEDCISELEFCGSNGECLERTCGNWSQYGSYFDETLCGDDEFCGQDGMCYPYRCEQWYQQGPTSALTGLGGENAAASELTCQSYPQEDAKANNLHGIVFGCNKYPPGNATPPSTEAVTMVFNERCIAMLDEDNSFDCYQFAEGTDFDTFRNDVDQFMLNVSQCSSDSGEPFSPIYWYQVTLGDFGIGTGPKSTSSFFSVVDAYQTIYAMRISTSLNETVSSINEEVEVMSEESNVTSVSVVKKGTSTSETTTKTKTKPTLKSPVADKKSSPKTQASGGRGRSSIFVTVANTSFLMAVASYFSLW